MCARPNAHPWTPDSSGLSAARSQTGLTLSQEHAHHDALTVGGEPDCGVGEGVRANSRKVATDDTSARRMPRSSLKFSELDWCRLRDLNPRPTSYKAAIGSSTGLCINHLQRLPAPSPGPPRHNYGTASLGSTLSRHKGFRVRSNLMCLPYYPASILPRSPVLVWRGAYG